MSIAVESIHKTFGTFTALQDVTLDFPKGELVALLGPSGCGKTTLLRIIAGLETADSGRVLFDDVDASHKHVRERKVGFVFQHYALFRHMSVFENIAFGLRVRPRKQRLPEAEIHKRVNNLLELVQLGWLADRSPAQLSGGQRQRVALARALAVEPQVLLLDEPFGALDAKVRKELRSWLRQLHEELHVTSIFVTHDQEEALELADRVVLMNRGRVEQNDKPCEVYENPATAFGFSFLGTSNIFTGNVCDGAINIEGIRVPLHDNSPEGSDVLAFVRPHDMRIVRNTDTSEKGISAKVNRIHGLGALARVELVAITSTSAPPRKLEVELPRQNLATLGICTGDIVSLIPEKIRTFPKLADELPA